MFENLDFEQIVPYICSTIIKNKKIMRLSKAAILALKGMSRDQKEKIAESCDREPSTVYRWIANADDNLTKAGPLKAIREITGLTDNELLEEESEVKEA